MVLANIATPIPSIASQITAIGTNLPGIDADLAPVGTQFSPLLSIDVSSLTFLSHRGAHATEDGNQQQQTSKQILHNFSPPHSKVKGHDWPNFLTETRRRDTSAYKAS
jgi:hypothetical protein